MSKNIGTRKIFFDEVEQYFLDTFTLEFGSGAPYISRFLMQISLRLHILNCLENKGVVYKLYNL